MIVHHTYSSATLKTKLKTSWYPILEFTDIVKDVFSRKLLQI